MSQEQPLLFLSKCNHFVSVNKSFYDKKTGATQTDPDLALRHTDRRRQIDGVDKKIDKQTWTNFDFKHVQMFPLLFSDFIATSIAILFRRPLSKQKKRYELNNGPTDRDTPH